MFSLFPPIFQSGKECLGEIMYNYITADQFSPESLLAYLDLSSEYTTLEIANRIEAAVHIWRQKYQNKRIIRTKSGRSSWGGKVKGFVSDIERSKLLAHRADTILQNLKLRFPSLPQTALDMNKIQYNKVCHMINLCNLAFALLFLSIRIITFYTTKTPFHLICIKKWGNYVSI